MIFGDSSARVFCPNSRKKMFTKVGAYFEFLIAVFTKLLEIKFEQHTFKLKLTETYRENLEKYSRWHISREAHCKTSPEAIKFIFTNQNKK